MKFKKAAAIVLALMLCLALAAPAMAAGPHVEVSKQTLMVDGVVYKCDKYNIDDNNYFKLRDLAFVLSGTGSQFSVGWDAASGTVSIVTGEAYQSIGKELLLGKDASATAQKTAQTILINGEKVTDINVYNIGGSNYFRLRDLGNALGFDVDYDAPTGTAIVKSHPLKYQVSKRVETGTSSDYDYDENGDYYEYSYKYKDTYVYNYDAKGNLVSDKSEYTRDGETTYSDTTEYTYDENGNELSYTYSYSGGTPYTREYTYNSLGNILTAKTIEGGEVTDSQVYTYNERGFCIKVVSEDKASGYSSENTMTYDERNNLIKDYTKDSDGDDWCTEYTYDAAGNILTEKYTSWFGSSSLETYTYNDAGQRLTETYETKSDYGTSRTTYTYTYNDSGFCAKTVYSYTAEVDGEKDETTYTEEYTYDSNGLILTDTTTYSDGTVDKYTVTYTAKGQYATVVYTTTDPDSEGWHDEYNYDSKGNLVKYVETWDDGYVRTTVYTYDANGNCLSETRSDADGEIYANTTEYIEIK